MPGVIINDFSGGMVRDISELLSPDNVFKTIQNLDVWSEKGVAKLLKNITPKHSFPTDKDYDSHVIFPVQGDKDYAIVLMTDGTIYTYEPTSGFSASPILSTTAGARMAYAGDAIYVFYRDMETPTLANTVRERIYYDYDAGTFEVEDVIITEEVSIFAKNIGLNVAHDGDDTVFFRHKIFFTSVFIDGAESFGIEYIDVNTANSPFYYVIERTSDFCDFKVYVAIDPRPDNEDSPFLTSQLLHNINAGEDSSRILFSLVDKLGGGSQTVISQDNTIPGFRVWTKVTGTNITHPLYYIVNVHLDSAIDYIDVGNKVKVAGKEYAIVSITENTADANNQWFEIELDDTIDPDLSSEGFLEVELKWFDDKFVIPISRAHSDILLVPIDENRPESKYTSGTGNLVAFASNKLFTANPYFPDVYSTGKDEDKKGFIAWNFITGEGKHAYSLIPDINLIAPTFSGSRIVDIFAFQDTLFILMESGIARLKFENNNFTFLQNGKYGSTSRFKYFTDLNNMFISSNKKVYAGAIEKLNYETGSFDFLELGRNISSLIETMSDVRLTYDNNREILYVEDAAGSDAYICSLRNGQPVWVKLQRSGIDIYSGFKLNGNFYLIIKETSSGDFKIREDDTAYHTNDIIIEDKDRYLSMENSFIRKLEVLYMKTSGTVSFEVILDDTTVKTESLPNKTAISFHEIKLSRSDKIRTEKFRWKLSTSGISSDFKLLGIFINRDSYGSEYTKGY